ncbi:MULTISPECIES: hypothetical protein [Gallibacterium]|uniref:hypothetical protein n=1 Tax=Gallibacterium TaxID=155493 RepID=UPI000ABCC30C|nr:MULTISPECIES: hypothetical protein [Gallibacterium]
MKFSQNWQKLKAKITKLHYKIPAAPTLVAVIRRNKIVKRKPILSVWNAVTQKTPMRLGR